MLLQRCRCCATLRAVALQFETEKVGETYTIQPAEDGTGADLAGTVQVIRCRVHDDEQPNARAEFDFQVWTHEEGGDRSAFLRAVKLESLPRHYEIDAAPLTISAVRNWPLARWESAARGVVSVNPDGKALKEFLDKTPKGRGRTRPATDEEKRLFRAEALLWEAFPEIEHAGDTPGERRHWNGLRKLAEAAVIYRDLVTEGRADPSAEMARVKNVSPATARSWIYRARQVGLLGPAVGRTPGEVPKAVDLALAAIDAQFPPVRKAK